MSNSREVFFAFYIKKILIKIVIILYKQTLDIQWLFLKQAVGFNCYFSNKNTTISVIYAIEIKFAVNLLMLYGMFVLKSLYNKIFFV